MAMLNPQGIVRGRCHLPAAFRLAMSAFTPQLFRVNVELEQQYQLSSSPIWYAGLSISLLDISANILISQAFKYIQLVPSSNNHLPF